MPVQLHDGFIQVPWRIATGVAFASVTRTDFGGTPDPTGDNGARIISGFDPTIYDIVNLALAGTILTASFSAPLTGILPTIGQGTSLVFAYEAKTVGAVRCLGLIITPGPLTGRVTAVSSSVTFTATLRPLLTGGLAAGAMVGSRICIGRVTRRIVSYSPSTADSGDITVDAPIPAAVGSRFNIEPFSIQYGGLPGLRESMSAVCGVQRQVNRQSNTALSVNRISAMPLEPTATTVGADAAPSFAVGPTTFRAASLVADRTFTTSYLPNTATSIRTITGGYVMSGTSVSHNLSRRLYMRVVDDPMNTAGYFRVAGAGGSSDISDVTDMSNCLISTWDSQVRCVVATDPSGFITLDSPLASTPAADDIIWVCAV